MGTTSSALLVLHIGRALRQDEHLQSPCCLRPLRRPAWRRPPGLTTTHPGTSATPPAPIQPVHGQVADETTSGRRHRTQHQLTPCKAGPEESMRLQTKRPFAPVTAVGMPPPAARIAPASEREPLPAYGPCRSEGSELMMHVSGWTYPQAAHVATCEADCVEALYRTSAAWRHSCALRGCVPGARCRAPLLSGHLRYGANLLWHNFALVSSLLGAVVSSNKAHMTIAATGAAAPAHLSCRHASAWRSRQPSCQPCGPAKLTKISPSSFSSSFHSCMSRHVCRT